MLAAFETWLAAHPVVRGALYLLLVAAVGAVVNIATWQPSPEAWAEFQAKSPRLAAWVRACRAVFPHLMKFPWFRAIAAMFLPPTDPPAAGGSSGGGGGGASSSNASSGGALRSALGRLALVATAAVMLAGCPKTRGASAPQAVADAAVQKVARILVTAERACVDIADQMYQRGMIDEAVDLAEKCDAVWKSAQAPVKAAAAAVDAWGAAESAGNLACATRGMVESIDQFVALLRPHITKDGEQLVNEAHEVVGWVSSLAGGGASCPRK